MMMMMTAEIYRLERRAYKNTATDSHLHITGSANHSTGSANHSTGSANHSTGSANHSAGSANHITGSANHSTGSAKHNTGSVNHSTGSANHSTGIITNKLHGTSQLPNVRPALYILMQTAATLGTRCMARKFFAE